jgi:hypothetical protein
LIGRQIAPDATAPGVKKFRLTAHVRQAILIDSGAPRTRPRQKHGLWTHHLLD